MKANEFVKKFGCDGAKRVIELTIGNSWADHYNIKEDSIGTAGTIYSKKLCEHNDNFVCLRNLKRLVESHELVVQCGGLEDARSHLESIRFNIATKTWFGQALLNWSMYADKLEKAIADVESCL